MCEYLALETYPDIPLKEARELHEAAHKLLAAGVDPCLDKKAQNSFESSREWFDKFSVKWVKAGRKRVLSRLEHDLFPYIGHWPIAELEPPETKVHYPP